MNPDIKKKWVEALTSGEFKQTKKHLRDTKGHCCLGVLCEVYRKETGKGEWREAAGGVIEFVWVDERGRQFQDSEALPPPVVDWADVGDGNPYIGLSASAADANDDGEPFTNIAQAIEETL